VKPIKMFGLAVLTALMAMAFVGAGSAMAESTELCAGDPGTGETATCPPGEAVLSFHKVSVGKAQLLASPEVQCNVLFESTKVGAAGAPQVIEGHFTYTNCGCTVKEKSGTTAKINVLREGHETASVTGEAEIIVACFGIECTYKGTGLKGTGKGPLLSTEANGEINLLEQEVTGKGAFCPSKGKLDIKATSLAAAYVGKGGALHYCVEYLKASTGYYLNDTCTTLDPGRSGQFMLVIGPAGLAVNDHVCADIISKTGLYKDSACTSDDAANKSLYEMGLVKTIQ
jgi:hypothetical protein